MEREHQVLATAASRLAQRKRRWKGRGGNMKRRAGVVKVVRVDGGAVCERREARGSLHRSADDAGGFPVRKTQRRNVLPETLAQDRSRSRQRQTEAVGACLVTAA